MAALSQFSLVGLRRLVMPLMIVAVALLILVWIPGLGVVRGGARRWVRLGPVLAEPSELVKFAVVFFLADFLAKRQDLMSSFKRGPLPAFLIVGPIALIVLKQPDFGTTVMLALVLFALLFAAGARAKHLGAAGGLALAVLVIQAIAKPYRMKRLTTFMDPWGAARGAGFQLTQSFIALGEGGGWGMGLGAGRQKMFYLPQAHTDFVFAVVVEEFGMIGALMMFALFCAILFRGMRIAHEEPDPFASLLAVGLTAMLSLQALVNMAVVIGLVPTKGLPLPFLSYGGTSMVMAMAAVGALLALSRRPAVR
jgi:cell division protein FtsW